MRHVSFKPGKKLWAFTLIFLPTFIILGNWQLNRANEKDQMLAQARGSVLLFDDVNWSEGALYRDVLISGQYLDQHLFFLDNKTFNGQFGYEVWRAIKTPKGSVLVSLGWVPGSTDRAELPTLTLTERIDNARVTVRLAPINPVFDVDANSLHPNDENVWIVQSLSAPWVEAIINDSVLGFTQLVDSEQLGLGPNIWQPSVMTPLKHRGYAVQWFAMAIALFGMFIYAGLKPNEH